GDEKESDEDEVRDGLEVARHSRAARERDRQKDRAGSHEANAGHEHGRNGLDGDGDDEIRRAPDRADDGEGEPGESAVVLHLSLSPSVTPPTFSRCVFMTMVVRVARPIAADVSSEMSSLSEPIELVRTFRRKQS